MLIIAHHNLRSIVDAINSQQQLCNVGSFVVKNKWPHTKKLTSPLFFFLSALSFTCHHIHRVMPLMLRNFSYYLLLTI